MPRDLELLEILSTKVRLLSLRQIAGALWAGAVEAEQLARRRTTQLEEEQLLLRTDLHCHPELPLEMPLARWCPGQDRPDFGPITYRLSSRWSEAPRSIRSFVATTRAAHMFGGVGGRLPRRSEASHDLSLANLFLKFRSETPERARAWVAEGLLPKGKGVKVPDALLREGGRTIAIEFAGSSYSTAKLNAFHVYCAQRAYPYELW